jgi:hypothetical protein
VSDRRHSLHSHNEIKPIPLKTKNPFGWVNMTVERIAPLGLDFFYVPGGKELTIFGQSEFNSWVCHNYLEPLKLVKNRSAKGLAHEISMHNGHSLGLFTACRKYSSSLSSGG